MHCSRQRLFRRSDTECLEERVESGFISVAGLELDSVNRKVQVAADENKAENLVKRLEHCKNESNEAVLIVCTPVER